mgnify:CR=1 FL=1
MVYPLSGVPEPVLRVLEGERQYFVVGVHQLRAGGAGDEHAHPIRLQGGGKGRSVRSSRETFGKMIDKSEKNIYNETTKGALRQNG